jgi:hypothetical protein
MEADVRRPEARRPMVESRIRNYYTVRAGNVAGSQSSCTKPVHHNDCSTAVWWHATAAKATAQ